jgi:hypothetical protein
VAHAGVSAKVVLSTFENAIDLAIVGWRPIAGLIPGGAHG